MTIFSKLDEGTAQFFHYQGTNLGSLFEFIFLWFWICL